MNYKNKIKNKEKDLLISLGQIHDLYIEALYSVRKHTNNIPIIYAVYFIIFSSLSLNIFNLWLNYTVGPNIYTG